MNQTPITESQLQSWSEHFNGCPQRRLAELALAKAALNDAAYVSKGAYAMRQKFSVEIETLEVTNQQASGRCWLFAATNVLREKIAKDKNLEKFELSQSYLAFWDKFERANYFLESILETASLPADDRVVAHILTTGVHDGGQWDMFVNIVEKYGIVPKDVYDETYQSSHTGMMNSILNRSLKAAAVKLRGMVAAGASEAEIGKAKGEILDKVYGFLCSCYGEPPKTFDFEYVDKDKAYHIERGCTPLGFYRDNIGDMLAKTVSIINAPTADKPYRKTFTVRFLGNVIGGKPVKHLNLPMEDFKKAIIAQLQAGKVVWFGSDVGKFGERVGGIWDDGTFNFELLTGLDLDISKEDSLNYWFSAMNHAMVITGVNLDENGNPTRWKIENSWGEKSGEKGFYVCSDSWFDQYVYQAAVEIEYLGELASLWAQEPVELDPWDPMGTLAD
ncbi:MAG: C1 family peptidase [Oscillospiraceae bacterium]|jgi:bleomycin hydrolase|nr:C1 family peptidase [Oscillospiraceae bacterium]